MRTENTIKNAGASLITQSVIAILQFVSRRIFIVTLGNTYLSFDGLFSNILTMLSLAELGFGEAIIFCLYKPLACKDETQIKSLMNYYAKIYRIVAMTILVLGTLLIPVLPFLMKDAPEIPESLTLIYFLFLLNTVVSYIGIYKQSILIADQKNYVVYNVKMIVSIVAMISQMVLLLTTQNYILYLISTIATTLFINIYVSIVVDKRYPFLKAKEKNKLDGETKKTISLNVRSLMIYKIGTMLVTGVDNLVISSFISVLSVGIYSNYTLIVNKASQILRSLVSATTGSVGNLNATESNEKKESIARTMLFIVFWIFGFASSGMFVLINHFIYYLAGKEYLFNTATVLFVVLDFYLLGVISPMSIFRNAMGLYRYGKYRPIACAITNLVVSCLLVKPLGILGVLLGTFIARFFITSWYEPVLVYKYGFKMSTRGYLTKYISYFGVLLLGLGLSYLCCLPFSEFTIFNFIMKILIVTVVTNLLFLVVFFKTKEFTESKDLVFRVFRKILKKKKL